jgi:hypothetical protein
VREARWLGSRFNRYVFPDTSKEQSSATVTLGNVPGAKLNLQHGPPLTSEWYRARAADCAALAEHAPNALSRAFLEDMAATWFRLAELVDRLDERVP